MNNVVLVGNMTSEAELKFTQGKGTAVATFNIAVNDGYGENKKTYFIPIVVWGKTAEAVANYTDKGSKILVNGKIQTRSYEAKDGSKRYVTEVVANMYDGIEFLGNKTNSTNNVLTPEDDGDIPF